jgi:hypothetical protein
MLGLGIRSKRSSRISSERSILVALQRHADRHARSGIVLFPRYELMKFSLSASNSTGAGKIQGAGAFGVSGAIRSGPRAKAPYPRDPWDPHAVSDPRMLVAEFPTLRFKDGSGPLCA